MTLAGRSAAIRTLTDAFTDCAEGCSRTVLMEGAAGCGKSALVHLLIERAAAAGAVVPCAAGSPVGHRSVRDMLRRLPALPPGGKTPRGGGSTARASRRRTPGRVRRAGANPPVMWAYDVHHADAESLDLVRHLTRRGHGGRLLLVAARTVPHDSGDRAFAAELMCRSTCWHIRLARLSPAEVTALAEQAGRRGQAAFLYDSSGGNPPADPHPARPAPPGHRPAPSPGRCRPACTLPTPWRRAGPGAAPPRTGPPSAPAARRPPA
ncbi:AAA family ATPase, partial [Streptomyces sp. NPDC001935]